MACRTSDDRAAAERRTAGKHLEQDRAGREEVAARVDGLAGDLLGRHVPRRAHQRCPCASVPSAVAERSSELRPREAEVEQLHAVRGQEDVRRLEVAMDDAARVQRGEARRGCRGRSATASERAQRAASQPLGERFALEQLHRDEQPAVVLADLVDLADVRMVDARRGPGLPPEAAARAVSSSAAADSVFRAIVRSSRSSRAA